ncbi:MAG: ABC transporter permease, partial [Gemmatimonadaceae bacterium]
MSALQSDLTFAFRTLRKSPGFTATAIITIALGIGASTAIFSVVNAVLLRPLPYAQPDRLALIQTDLSARKVYDFPLAPGDLPDLRSGAPLFEDIAGIANGRQALYNDAGEPEMVIVAGVTSNFFRTLGAHIARGRDFVDDDAIVAASAPAENNGLPPAPGAAQQPTSGILSDGMWRRRFGGDPQIVGKKVRIGNQSVEIVGVLQPNFELLWPGSADINPHPDIYNAIRIDLATASRVNVFLRAVGRLKPNATFARAQAQIDAVVKDLRQRFPIKETAGYKIRVEPMHDYAVADVKPALLALMGAVAFVLLIACANVANLLLVRASQRERDLAVRSALGCSRWELIQQMLVESFVISAAGALLGIALAWVGVRALVVIGPPNLMRLGEVGLNAQVLLFSVIAAAMAALLFGVVPALRASRVDLGSTLRATGRSGGLSGAGKWLRNSVVVVEVALAFVLLVGSGLMIRSFAAVQSARPGFDASAVVMLQVPNQNQNLRGPDAIRAFTQQLQDKLSADWPERGLQGAADALHN